MKPSNANAGTKAKRRSPGPKQHVFVNTEGEMALGIPLSFYERPESEALDSMPGYRIMLSPRQPEAWAIQFSEGGFFITMLPLALKNLENLGEL